MRRWRRLVGSWRLRCPVVVVKLKRGYVSKDSYDVKNCKITVDVSEFDDLDEMILQICNTETTGSDPYDEDDWYRILKVGYDSKVYVQNCIDGVVSTKVATTWAGSTGELTIDVCDGAIAFYEDGDLVYSEPYALPSYDCYLYVFTSTLRSRSSGTDKFDDFTFAPTPSFWDYFEDVDDPYWWTVDWGSWQVQDGKLENTDSASMIHSNDPCFHVGHVRTEMKTTNAGSSTWHVGWLMVKWINWDNCVYALLHKDGGVELTVISGGDKNMYTNTSNLTPLNKHAFDVSIIGNTARMWIDGTLYVTANDAYFDDWHGHPGCRTDNAFAELDSFTGIK
ncbi:MAG: hypothetical protein ACOC6G_00645 [Thermoproteota archaeon]